MKTSEEMFLEKIAHGFAEIVKDNDGSFRLFRVPCALLPNWAQESISAVIIRQAENCGFG